jgi:membrane-associated phospholipid phosphatase
MTVRGSLAIATLAFHATLLPLPALAQTDFVPSAVAPATVPSSGPLISRQAAAIAGLLFAGTLLGDHEFREESQEHRDATTNSVASVGNTFGDWRMLIPATAAGYLAGEIAGSNAIKGTVLRAGAAVALATGISTGLKYTVGRTRPDVAGTNIEFRPFSGSASFPSGHTAAAFAIATAVADQTHDRWSDYLLYGAASVTALSRINNNRHWTSDVLIGGLVGHLSAKWIGRKMGPVQVAPTGVSVNLQF